MLLRKRVLPIALVVNAMLVIALVAATNTGNIAMTAINLFKVFYHHPYDQKTMNVNLTMLN